MHGNRGDIQRFVVLADIYFRLTGKSGADMSGEEMESLYTLITQCSSPEQFYQLVEFKIKTKHGASKNAANIPADGMHMLPPEQRIL